MHFEGRKHIVEYDDVANEQRKIIYKFRNELLDPNFDISAKIEQNREEYMPSLLAKADIYEGMSLEEFNLEKLSKLLLEELGMEVSTEELAGKEYDELLEYLIEKAKKEYEEKMSLIDEETRKEIERELYLKELDESWREHLYQMDNMKTGIRLRAYNQKDPLVEYKKESYNLFTELINDLKANIIKTLHMIRFQFETPEEEAQKLAQKLEMERRQEEMQRSLNLEEEESETKKKKPARNDPCPCGSGKKYKQCCGKSGPKKGVFAS